MYRGMLRGSSSGGCLEQHLDRAGCAAAAGPCKIARFGPATHAMSKVSSPRGLRPSSGGQLRIVCAAATATREAKAAEIKWATAKPEASPPPKATRAKRVPKSTPATRRQEAALAGLEELEAVTSQALVMNESLSDLVQALYAQIQDLQGQNLELLGQQQENLLLRKEHLRLAEARLERVQELQERDQFCQDVIVRMQQRLDGIKQALSRSSASAIPVTLAEQMSRYEQKDEPALAVKLLEDLCKDKAAMELHKHEALPLAVKLLNSGSPPDIQEKAAVTLLNLVTSNGGTDNQACHEAIRLGAGPLVTKMLRPQSNEGVHASVLPLWNVLTISEMIRQN